MTLNLPSSLFVVDAPIDAMLDYSCNGLRAVVSLNNVAAALLVTQARSMASD
jgi:hypothetical protein